MAKKHDHDEVENHNEQHTEVHVESHSEQTVSSSDSQLEELTNDLKRVQAEFLNYKRRADEERADMINFAKSRVIREFLTVRDSFDHELNHRPADIDAKWAESIDSIRAQFDKVLKNLGVERFESAGHAFDPHCHEAVMMDDGEGAHEVVLDELQAGYKLGDTVIRHAMVKVGRSDEVKNADQPSTDQQPDIDPQS